MQQRSDEMCFACGKDNPIGLKLEFMETGDAVTAKFIPLKEHQGYNEMMHGGLISTLLDEAMAKFLFLKHIRAVTGKLEVRFRHPVPIGALLTIKASEVLQRRKLHQLRAAVYLPDGEMAAEAQSTFMELPK